MITLTIECSRCGKESSQDMTGHTLNDDAIRKLGFGYVHTGKENVIICIDCERKYKDLKDKLDSLVRLEKCEFFDNCEGEENGDYRGPKNV